MSNLCWITSLFWNQLSDSVYQWFSTRCVNIFSWSSTLFSLLGTTERWQMISISYILISCSLHRQYLKNSCQARLVEVLCCLKSPNGWISFNSHSCWHCYVSAAIMAICLSTQMVWHIFKWCNYDVTVSGSVNLWDPMGSSLEGGQFNGRDAWIVQLEECCKWDYIRTGVCGILLPDVVVSEAHQNDCSYVCDLIWPTFDSLCKNLSWWRLHGGPT